MGIVLDEGFMSDYNKLGFERNIALPMAQEMCLNADRSLFTSVMNMVVVGEVIPSSYSRIRHEVIKDVSFDTHVIRGLLISIILLRGIDDSSFSCFVKKPRHIEEEVISSLYGIKVDKEKSKELSKIVGLPSYNVEEKPNISWDEHFFNICLQVSRNSKCFSRKIGAILVRDKRVISTGYNGAPSGIPPCDKRWIIDPVFSERFSEFSSKKNSGKCPRQVIGFKSGEGIEWCPAAHAEENTIVNCARLGISAKGSIMFMSCGIPCSKCMIKIINAGVEEIVVTKLSYYDETSKYLLENSDVRVRIYDFVDKPLIK